jgi:hypothetical protein
MLTCDFFLPWGEIKGFTDGQTADFDTGVLREFLSTVGLSDSLPLSSSPPPRGWYTAHTASRQYWRTRFVYFASLLRPPFTNDVKAHAPRRRDAPSSFPGIRVVKIPAAAVVQRYGLYSRRRSCSTCGTKLCSAIHESVRFRCGAARRGALPHACEVSNQRDIRVCIFHDWNTRH